MSSSSSSPTPSPYHPPSSHLHHSSYSHPLTRSFHAISSGATISNVELMYPIFVHEHADQKEEIKSLPGQYRWGVNVLDELLSRLSPLGLSSVLLFGVIDSAHKTPAGDFATDAHTPVVLALKLLREKYPHILRAVDVCLCGYTNHGHCGILRDDPIIHNQKSIDRLASIAVHFASHGAQMIAPSDMMDGRIGAIKTRLRDAFPHVSIMSYSSKFASCFYGPFRDAACSGAQFGDRASYQLPVGGRGLAISAAKRDVKEGADFVMVKPGGPYLDIVRDLANSVSVPIAIYHVSGEYAMLWHAAAAGAFKLKDAVEETLKGMKRAGATVIITYFTPYLLEEWAKK